MESIENDYHREYDSIPDSLEGRLNYIIHRANMKRQKVLPLGLINQIQEIKWEKLSYTIYLVPKGTPRPRLGQKGVFYVKGAKDHKKVFRRFWKEFGQHQQEMIVNKTKFSCRVYMPTPKSMSVAERVAAELGYINPISKPDWDNLAKTYCDMIQGMLLYDDALIYKGELTKFYSIKPRIEVDIEYATAFDCNFNMKKIEKILKGVRDND